MRCDGSGKLLTNPPDYLECPRCGQIVPVHEWEQVNSRFRRSNMWFGRIVPHEEGEP